ncbi:Cytoplasmic tRNA 2-thiolation protein 2, partial [Spiromyces aspiralis]
MKDMLAKEIAYFNHCLELETAHTPTFTTKAPTKASIGRATEAFIVGLDRDYLSTVSTVGRTAAKLQPTQETRGAPSCIMCSMPVGANSSIWRGRVTVSNVTGGVMKLTPSTASSAQMPLSPADSGGPDLTLTDWLCYSCQNTMRDVRTNTILPRFTIEALKYNASTASQGQEEYGSNLKVPVADTEPRQRLRKLVEEFLLSDTDDDDDDKDNNHSNNNEEGGT